MSRVILVAGTASHVGKSTVVTGLCRLLADNGVDVAPFKAQNMANNAWVVPIADDGRAGEIGVSQYVQARAARTPATTDNNPVLLKPSGDGRSQLVIQGRPVGTYRAGEYYSTRWSEAKTAAVDSFDRLATSHEVIVAEGAGSIGEPNLLHRDLANIETARFADATILLLADIERGGAFASLYGTLELTPNDIRDRIAGVAITKFHGDTAILKPGFDQFERHAGIPVLGVLPYTDLELPAEDSLSVPTGAVLGANDGVPARSAVRIGVPRFNHIANVTDIEPLARTPGVRVVFLDPADELIGIDGIVLPGSKNTVADLHQLRSCGFVDELRQFPGPIVGICAGYQMMGERLLDAHLEDPRSDPHVDGIGLIPVETTFDEHKRVAWTTRSITGGGFLGSVSGTVTGYEIRYGRIRQTADAPAPFDGDGTVTDSILGTHFHGVFDTDQVREAFVDAVYQSAQVDRPPNQIEVTDPYTGAAQLVREHLDIEPLGLG